MTDTETSAGVIERLIEQLEKAAGPSRELDRDIYEFVKRGRTERSKLEVIAARYTESIDAALTLVAKDSVWEVANPRVYRHIPTPLPYPNRPYQANVGVSRPNAWGATPAIALCRAALKARSIP